MRQPVIRTPFTERDKALIRALAPARINYFPGSSAKRFARTMNHDLEHRETIGMTDKQRRFMNEIAYKHRKQLPKTLQQSDLPSLDEIDMNKAIIDDELGCIDHLEPFEAEVEELAVYKRDAIRSAAVDHDQLDLALS